MRSKTCYWLPDDAIMITAYSVDLRRKVVGASERGTASWSGYHRRSLLETKMRCFKLLGERIMARDFDRQVAELQVRAAVLNRLTRLGKPITVAMP
jgi:hypothetical protein